MWLASHDRFFHVPVGTAYVYASADLVEWTPVANVTPMYWAQLFAHNNVTYLLGTSDDMSGAGNLVLSRCRSVPCDGRDWDPPVVLFSNATYHVAPTPVVESNGDLFRAVEYRASADNDLAVVMLRGTGTGDCGLDLTRAGCWQMSNGVRYPHSTGSGRQWEEAGAVADDDGGLHVLVRLDAPVETCATVSKCNRVARLEYSRETATLTYVRDVSLPSSCNKFAVRRSPADGLFYTLANPVTVLPNPNHCGQRNVVVLTVSADLDTWHTCGVVMADDSGLAFNDSVRYTGLQYIDFAFDGADLVAAVRAGYRGSTTYHDANRLLIARITGYAKRCQAREGMLSADGEQEMLGKVGEGTNSADAELALAGAADSGVGLNE